MGSEMHSHPGLANDRFHPPISSEHVTQVSSIAVSSGPVQLPEKRWGFHQGGLQNKTLYLLVIVANHTHKYSNREGSSTRDGQGQTTLLCTWIQPFLKMESLGFSIKRINIVYFPLFPFNSVLVTFLSLATWRSLTSTCTVNVLCRSKCFFW